MKRYKNVLLALELDPESDKKIIKKAKEVVDYFDCELMMIHVVEHLSNYGAAYGVSAGIDVEEILNQEAAKAMQKIGKQMDVDEKHQIIKVGPAKQIILEEAKRVKADLIIVGSHGRHGVRLLLGSTSNAVLHGAQCDVLAVRVKG